MIDIDLIKSVPVIPEWGHGLTGIDFTTVGDLIKILKKLPKEIEVRLTDPHYGCPIESCLNALHCRYRPGTTAEREILVIR